MKASEALIAWTPASETDEPTCGQIRVGSYSEGREPGRDWAEPYACTGGAAFADRQQMEGIAQTAAVFIDFAGLVVRDGLDARVVHEAFLAIDEYRDAFPS